ncbi:unnamed protein product [Ceratitis capitata]|uniref:(Mediterranean fruit fly) hypothetical protein n=1 Tax=Ceratitis capitata TaxID=7213 RepID=A0A811UDN1_CERCA|nr:unnamed protein product [Ceratitis capitata]
MCLYAINPVSIVSEVPGKDPIITGIKSRYRLGDIVRGNCTSRHSKPAANLTWTINGRETNPSHIRHHKPMREPRELETAVSGIHFVVTPQHFSGGKLKIRCTAHIHDVYWKSTEKSIEEERHKHNINSVNTFSDDYFDMEDGQLVDRSDTYMTHIKGAVSSLNANGATHQHCHCLSLLLIRWTTLTLAAWYTLRYFRQLCEKFFIWHERQASKTTTTAIQPATKTPITTVAEESAILWAKGQILTASGKSVDQATPKAVVTTTKAAGAAKTTTATRTVCHAWAAVAVEHTKYRTHNETTSSQLIERIIVQCCQQQQQQQPHTHHQQQQRTLVECDERRATQQEKHFTKAAMQRIANKPKATTTATENNTENTSKLTVVNATATACL